MNVKLVEKKIITTANNYKLQDYLPLRLLNLLKIAITKVLQC